MLQGVRQSLRPDAVLLGLWLGCSGHWRLHVILLGNSPRQKAQSVLEHTHTPHAPTCYANRQPMQNLRDPGVCSEMHEMRQQPPPLRARTPARPGQGFATPSQSAKLCSGQFMTLQTSPGLGSAPCRALTLPRWGRHRPQPERLRCLATVALLAH